MERVFHGVADWFWSHPLAMALLMAWMLLGGTSMLAGCSTPDTVVQERVERVNVPVAVGCVVNRPTPPEPLKSVISADQWAEMTVSQRAAAVSAQALRRLNFGEALNAATGACPPA